MILRLPALPNKNLLVSVILNHTFAKDPVQDESVWRRMALMVAGSRFFWAGRAHRLGLLPVPAADLPAVEVVVVFRDGVAQEHGVHAVQQPPAELQQKRSCRLCDARSGIFVYFRQSIIRP